jgi:CheY-like chemotaxis protein
MILVVDDYADGGVVLQRLLTISGYPCDWVPDGATALAKVRAHSRGHPLLVVLDEMMPEMSGLEVLHHLRADPATADTNVIMYSAREEGSVEYAEAMKLGALAWVRKAAANNNMLAEICQWYERVGGVKRERPGVLQRVSA